MASVTHAQAIAEEALIVVMRNDWFFYPDSYFQSEEYEHLDEIPEEELLWGVRCVNKRIHQHAGRFRSANGGTPLFTYCSNKPLPDCDLHWLKMLLDLPDYHAMINVCYDGNERRRWPPLEETIVNFSNFGKIELLLKHGAQNLDDALVSTLAWAFQLFLCFCNMELI